MRLSFLLSTLLHLLLISVIMFRLDKQQEEERRGNVKNRASIKSKIISVEVVDVEEKTEEKGDYATSKKETVSECKSFYVGIGITSNVVIKNDEFWIQVVKVHEGYPAHKYGLQVGDLILEKEPIRDGGPVGSVVKLHIDRNGETILLSIPRGKICVEQ